MKIVCPSCDAMYEVPEAVVTSRRKMRCARCSRDWVPADSMAAQAAPPPAVMPAPPAMLPDGPPGRPQAFGKASPEPPPPPQAASPLHDEPAPAAASTGYVLVDPVPEPDLPELDLPEPESSLDSRRDDEPYQLALRPETHINVFADRQTASAFGSMSMPSVRPVAKGPPILAWVVSVLVLLAFTGGAVMFRGSVMKAWPPSERLYAALGLVQQP